VSNVFEDGKGNLVHGGAKYDGKDVAAHFKKLLMVFAGNSINHILGS
jgi:hypothetical protein